MAFEDEAVEILRVMVDDLDAPQAFSDAKLLRVLYVAAFQVLGQVEFPTGYELNVVDQRLAPDPTAASTRDDSLLNLVTLKAACLIDRGSAVAAAGRAISVGDGGSRVDLRGVFGAKLQLLEKGWCAVYDQEKFEYQSGQARVAGAAVLTPFRLYAGGGLSRPAHRDREFY